MDANGNLPFRRRVSTPQAEGYEAILSTVTALVHDLEEKAGTRCQVGIGTPGALSRRTGRLKNSNTVCLNDRAIQQDLETRLHRPVRVANDANCFALSEACDGAAAGAETVFGVILGTGVGGGIVFRGQLHRGCQDIAGEWGHNPLETDGPPCYCGRQGCVETLLSGPGLLKDYLAHGGRSVGNVPELLARATDEEAAHEALERFLGRFGRALAVVVNILDPDVIVLGGGLSNIPELYTRGKEELARHVFNDELRTRLVPNVHGASSGVRGAARLWADGET